MPSYQDTIKLAFRHNLLIGNCPEIVEVDKLSDIIKSKPSASVESFGLFETSTPNYNTYYPDLKVEELAPKEEDFVQPVFRAISEVIAHKNWNPVDFSMNNVLRDSTNLLIGQSLYIDHETMTGNVIGSIPSVSWQESYTSKGVKVPAGINAKLKIDGKSNPRIARGVMMDPPAIHSTSVTVQFTWEKSHSSLSEADFWSKLGTYDADGKLIRKIANKIQAYHELSLVGHGADPFAQKVDKEGKIINPIYAGIMNNSREDKQSAKFYFFDFKSEILENSEDTIPEHLINNADSGNTDNDKNKPNMNEFLKLMATLLGLTTENPNEEQVTTKLKEVLGNVTSLTAQVTAKDGEIATLKAGVPNATELATLQAFHTKVLTSLKTETKRLYTLSCGKNTPSEAMVKMIDEANYEALQALHDQYKKLVDESMPLSCKSCGSTEINRASATQSEGGEGDQAEKPNNDPISIHNRYLDEQYGNIANDMHGIQKKEDKK